MMEDRKQVEEVVVVAQELEDIMWITEWFLLYHFRHQLQKQWYVPYVTSY